MNENTTISYCITVKDELIELTTLLNFLQLHIRNEDELVIQYDQNGVTPEVLDYLNILKNIHKNCIVTGFPLNDDFATFKNNLKKYCTKDYIVSLDADEIPHENLILNLPTVLERNPVDIIFIPRINIVNGLTELYANKYGWKITKMESQIGEKIIDTESEEYKYLKKLGYIIEETNDKIKYYKPINAWPDYQTRIYRRTDAVEWRNKVHERITGYSTFANFPAQEEWSLYHIKSLKKQIKQNNYYEKL